MRTVLALETSTAHASVAVVSDGQVLSHELSTSPKTHSEFLNPAIERCLKIAGLSLNQIDLFACGSGPGSFTGLRVAASIAKSFSMTFGKPLVVIDSLTLLMSEALRLRDRSEKTLCLINAHKNMAYTALFKDHQIEIPPRALTISEINQLDLHSEGPVLCIGEGYLAYERAFSDSFLKQIYRDPSVPDHPKAVTLGLLSGERARQGQTIEWNLFEPLYIRASEAEENQRVKTR